jgi:hypothetical protein
VNLDLSHPAAQIYRRAFSYSAAAAFPSLYDFVSAALGR